MGRVINIIYMLTLKLTLSKVTLNEPRIYAKSSGAVLATTAAILYIARADFA